MSGVAPDHPAPDHAGSDLYRTNPGSSAHTTATPPTQNNPPDTSENLVLTSLATTPDLSWPADGLVPQRGPEDAAHHVGGARRDQAGQGDVQIGGEAEPGHHHPPGTGRQRVGVGEDRREVREVGAEQVLAADGVAQARGDPAPGRVIVPGGPGQRAQPGQPPERDGEAR